MNRITIQTADSAPEEAGSRLADAHKANGFVPNLLGVLANAPTAIEAYQTVVGINARNSLTPAEREVVQITAAVRNGCGFCAAGHTKIARKKVGMDEAAVDALRASSPLPDAKLDALARFVERVIDNRGAVSDSELQAFLDAGYTETNALDVVLGVSLASLCNYANNLAKTPINPELQPFALN